ncbi:MAG: phospholipid carrier-dependent glycosyltransferase [Minisyncoccota bacterium]
MHNQTLSFKSKSVHRLTLERHFSHIVLLITMIVFFFLGFFHLGKFETTDEHLWKYSRIEQYWSAIKTQEWEQTYINDKPGVTVALISGIGLLFEPHPKNNEKIPQSGEGEKLFEAYNIAQSEQTNFTFRLPVLIFATLSLFLFFRLLFLGFASYPIALFSTIFIALNPILLGMSQIINPDSVFWIFGGLSICAYMALVRTKKITFLWLTGILTGFALLSKYTAFILFLFYGLFFLAHIIFQDSDTAKQITAKQLLRYLVDIFCIFLISLVIFSVFLPAVLFHPEYLFKGISQFLTLKNFLVIASSAFVLLLTLLSFQRLVGIGLGWLANKRHWILTIISSLFLLLITLLLINVWSGERLSPVSSLRDQAYANEPKEFNFKPILDRKDDSLHTTFQLFLMEATPLIFSVSPLVLFLFLCAFTQILLRKVSDTAGAIIVTMISFILLYLISAQYAQVVTNVRYIILLYPLIAILSAVILTDLFAKRINASSIFMRIAFLLLLVMGTLAFISRPFYFSYTNFLLPQTLSIHDSWGHGSYESAQYLNSLPDAERLIIWSNSDTVCRFFVGKCLKSRHIDLARVTPDYFVISKRGAIKVSNRFLLENNPQPAKDSDYYFDQLREKSVWSIHINNRPDNFIAVIPFRQ